MSSNNTDDTCTMGDLLDKPFLGVSIKIWILIILVALLVGYKNQVLPGQTQSPEPPKLYYY
jgi:hypothetical protein